MPIKIQKRGMSWIYRHIWNIFACLCNSSVPNSTDSAKKLRQLSIGGRNVVQVQICRWSWSSWDGLWTGWLYTNKIWSNHRRVWSNHDKVCRVWSNRDWVGSKCERSGSKRHRVWSNCDSVRSKRNRTGSNRSRVRSNRDWVGGGKRHRVWSDRHSVGCKRDRTGSDRSRVRSNRDWVGGCKCHRVWSSRDRFWNNRDIAESNTTRIRCDCCDVRLRCVWYTETARAGHIEPLEFVARHWRHELHRFSPPRVRNGKWVKNSVQNMM